MGLVLHPFVIAFLLLRILDTILAIFIISLFSCGIDLFGIGLERDSNPPLLLSVSSGSLEEGISKFKYVLVDEYQDTNMCQYFGYRVS